MSSSNSTSASALVDELEQRALEVEALLKLAPKWVKATRNRHDLSVRDDNGGHIEPGRRWAGYVLHNDGAGYVLHNDVAFGETPYEAVVHGRRRQCFETLYEAKQFIEHALVADLCE